MLDFTQKIEELKLKNDDLVNFRVSFNESSLYLEGEYIDEGGSNGYYTAGTLGEFFIPTDKGYVSAEWKKNDFYKMGRVENVDQDFINSLECYLQSEKPTTFIRKTEGWGVAGVIANHSNEKLYQEYKN